MTPQHLTRAAVFAALVASSGATVAQLASIDVNLAGWSAQSGFGLAGNTEAFIALPQGAIVFGFDYIDLNYTTSGDSWLSELVLSVNNSQTPSAWLDWSPSTTEAGGSFAGTGAWGGASGAGSPFGAGAAFTTTSPTVYVTSYLGYAVPPVGISIAQGTLRIHYDISPIPEPASMLLMALGLLAVGVAVRGRA